MVMMSLVVAWAVGGCEGLSFMSQPFAPKVKAIYKLPDRTTLIVVDDPGNLLNDPALTGVVAGGVKLELETNKAFEKGSVVSPTKLAEHLASLGDAAAQTPLDQLGRDLGAEQVIAVHIENAEMGQDPGAYRPTVLTRVKLIDVTTGKRQFPPQDVGAAVDASLAARGYPVKSQLFYRVGSTGTTLDMAKAVRAIAQRAGRDAARVFSDYRPREPGTPFEE